MDKELSYADIVNQAYPHKLVDLIDETYFGAETHKVRMLNESLDPIQWDLLQDLIRVMRSKGLEKVR